MNDSIRRLLKLQEGDLELDRIVREIAAIPARVAALKMKMRDEKIALENAKKDLTQLQMARKQKELDLETQEASIRKHSTELNAVKTNDAYRALLGEIEKAKKDKSVLEDQILQGLEDLDKAGRLWKEKELAHQGLEADLQKQISEWEARQRSLEQDVAARQSVRAQAAEALPKGLLAQYERLRQGGRGAAVVAIHSEQCGGCHMKVSQNLINEVRRGQKLIACESCSRIVYLEEVAAPASDAG